MSPTPYADANAILGRVLDGAGKVLGDQLVGMYCYGSLATGDFDPERSDIDFIVVTEDVLSDENTARLATAHEDIASSGLRYSDRLEGSYIHRSAFRRYDPTNARHPTVGVDWEFGVNAHGVDGVIQRWVIREYPVVVSGPPPETLIDPVPFEQVRTAVLQVVREWWAKVPDDPEWFVEKKQSERQAFAVLTMCRVLHLMDHGTLASKPVAAQWAMDVGAPREATLIEKCLYWKPGRADWDLEEVLSFVRYTVGRTVGARR